MDNENPPVSRRGFVSNTVQPAHFRLSARNPFEGRRRSRKFLSGSSAAADEALTTLLSCIPIRELRSQRSAIYSRIGSRKPKQRAENGTVYKDYQKVLGSNQPFAHPEHFKAAIQAKKLTYCEKLMRVDLPGVKRVIQAAKKADPKKVVSVGFQQSYGPVYLEAQKRLARAR